MIAEAITKLVCFSFQLEKEQMWRMSELEGAWTGYSHWEFTKPEKKEKNLFIGFMELMIDYDRGNRSMNLIKHHSRSSSSC